MTIPSETSRSGPYNGNGSTTVFGYGFRIVNEDHLKVIRTSVAGVETVLSIDADYTVSDVGEAAGGHISCTVAPFSGETITILRNVPFTQETDLENQGAYYAETVEDALDLATMRDQQIAELAGRAFRIPASIEGVDLEFPAPEPDKFIAWDSSARSLVNVNRLDLASVVAYGSAAADIFTGDGSRTSFDLSFNPSSINNLVVSLGGVAQIPGDDYSWPGGTTLSFAVAPPAGVKILARYMRALPQDLSDAGSSVFFQAGVGAIQRSMQDKGREIVSVLDFASATAADALSIPLFVPSETLSALSTGGDLNSIYWGVGQIKTADGNKRAKWFSQISAPPAATGNSDAIDTAFNGDWSHTHFAIEHRITGVGTLGMPTSGYHYQNEAFPIYGMMYVAPEAGHNQATTGNGGRTGAAFSRIDVKHYGNGDAVCYNGTAFIAGNKAGATSFLAQPAGVLFNGDMSCGANYVYMNPRELHLSDNGYDVACVGDVVNLHRTNGTGGQGAIWLGYRAQSVGSAAADAIISATGPWKNGIDFSMSFLDFGVNKAAISLKGGDRIYLNNASSSDSFTDAFNGDFLEFNHLSQAIIIVRGGNPILQVATDRLTMLKPPVLPTVVAAGLPLPVPGNKSMEYYVSDANATTRYATVVGGGTNLVKVFSNGASWLIA